MTLLLPLNLFAPVQETAAKKVVSLCLPSSPAEMERAAINMLTDYIAARKIQSVVRHWSARRQVRALAAQREQEIARQVCALLAEACGITMIVSLFQTEVAHWGISNEWCLVHCPFSGLFQHWAVENQAE